MTTIEIDIRSTGATTHPDDRVILYAPEVRARIGGGLVSTKPLEVELVDGQATVKNMEPGPVRVRFEVLGMADTSEKRGIVPDFGEVTLDDVLELKFTWTPPVVTAGLQQIIDQMNDALDAVGSAVHTAIEDNLVPLRQDLEKKANIGHQHGLDDVIGLQGYVDASIAESANTVVAGLVMKESPLGSGLYQVGGEKITVTEMHPDSGLYLIGATP